MSELGSFRVEITPTQYTLRPPCCGQPIILAREVTEITLVQSLTCQPCDIPWRPTISGNDQEGLMVCWQVGQRCGR